MSWWERFWRRHREDDERFISASERVQVPSPPPEQEVSELRQAVRGFLSTYTVEVNAAIENDEFLWPCVLKIIEEESPIEEIESLTLFNGSTFYFLKPLSKTIEYNGKVIINPISINELLKSFLGNDYDGSIDE